MMNPKESLKDHLMIRFPVDTQQTDRGAPHAEV